MASNNSNTRMEGASNKNDAAASKNPSIKNRSETNDEANSQATNKVIEDQLDLEIIAKQQGRSFVLTTQPGAYSAKNEARDDGSIHLDAFSENCSKTSPIEKDIMAKQRGRSVAGVFSTATIRPGAYSKVTSPPASSKENLKQFEHDVLAKQTSRRSTGSTSSTVLSQINQDVLAKQTGRATGSTDNLEATKPGAYPSNKSDADGKRDVLAKQTAAVVGSVRTAPSPLEKDGLAKLMSRTSDITIDASNKPGAYSTTYKSDQNDGLNEFERDILAKQRASGASAGASRTVQSSVDQDVLAKQMGRKSICADTSTKPGAYAATMELRKGDQESYSTLYISNNNNELNELERDILAKQRASSASVSRKVASSIDQDVLAKQMGMNSSTASALAKLGAYNAAAYINKGGPSACSTISESDNNNGLNDFEREILAKQRANAAGVSRTVLQSIDQDVLAKEMGQKCSSADTTTKPGAYTATTEFTIGAPCTYSITSEFDNNTGLNEFERDILAKQRASGAGAGMFRTALPSIDQDVLAKQLGQKCSGTDTSTKPGAYTAETELNKEGLTNLELDVLAKQTGGTGTYPLEIHQDLLAKKTSQLVLKHDEATTNTVILLGGISQLKDDIVAKQMGRATLRIAESTITDSHLDTSTAPTPIEGQAPEVFTSSNINDSAISIATKHNEIAHTDTTHGSEMDCIENTTADECVATAIIQMPDKNDTSESGSNLESHGLNLENVESESNEEGLAVAFAVDIDDDDKYLPSAIEFDPDAKPPMYRNRRFRLYLYFMISATVIGIVGATLGIVLTSMETAPELRYRASLGIRENIERVVDQKELDNISSPYRKALDWIMFSDPVEVIPESPNFFQRFILTYLYFATSSNEPWAFGCAPSDTEKDDCVVKYEDYFNNKLDSYDVRGHRWLSNITECKWVGVSCDNLDQVMEIYLFGFSKNSGTFPEGITKLPFMHSIKLKNCGMKGSLPTSIWRMNTLDKFDAGGNHISKTITDVTESRSLKFLLLSGNNITGNLTSDISRIHDLKDLDLSKNFLTGTIPSEVGEMINLFAILLYDNELVGSIPSTIGNLHYLRNLELGQNALAGRIPDAFIGLNNITDVWLQSNLLTGTIPDSLFELTTLVTLNIGNNMLSGTISNKISRAWRIYELFLENNQFTGTLPLRYGQTYIEFFHGQGNHFNGTVPKQLCELVQNRQIQELSFDCLEAGPDDGASAPEIVCPEACCTMCCNLDGDFCTDMSVWN